MHAYRMFFNTMISCISFVMVMLTVGGIGYIIANLTGADGDDFWGPAVYVITIVLFFSFMRRTTKMLGGVTKNLDEDPTEVDDTRLMQDLHHAMLRMDERVESLETILMDKIKPEARDHAGRR